MPKLDTSVENIAWLALSGMDDGCFYARALLALSLRDTISFTAVRLHVCVRDDILQVLQHLHEKLAHEGIRMICVLTKSDKVDPSIAADIRCLRANWRIHRLRELVGNKIGLPVNQVCDFCC